MGTLRTLEEEKVSGIISITQCHADRYINHLNIQNYIAFASLEV